MPRSDDSLERLRAAIDELATLDAADLLAEARIEARARVRATLTDALAASMLDRLHEQLPAPAHDPPPALSADTTRSAPKRTGRRPAARKRTPRPDPAPEATSAPEPAWYVYGVVASEAELAEPLPGVDPAEPVKVLSEGALAAVASRVPLEEFDEAHMREHLADMAWVEATARAHEAVLDRVRGQVTVIPMRMCTVYRTEGGVREMLQREAAPLTDALDQLAGKAEWAVKAFVSLERDAVGPGSGAGESSGAAYMERKRTERERREEAVEMATEATALIHDRLSLLADDARVIALQRREASGHDGDMILNGVYLVADDAAAAFHDELDALQVEFEPHGIDLVPTGPWPAYNFVPGTIGAGW